MGEVAQVILNFLLGIGACMVLYFAAQLIRRQAELWSAKLTKAQADAKTAGDTAKAAAFQFALAVLDAVTYSVVSRIEAEQAYQLRKAVKAGEAEVTKLQLLSTEAYQDIVARLGDGVKACLDDAVEDTEAFVRDKIEELLPKAKADYRKTLTGEGDESKDAEAVED